MAVAFGAALGSLSVTNANASASLSFNTTAAVPAGGRVIVNAGFFKNSSGPSIGCTVGGNAATLAKRTTNGNDYAEVWSYYTAAGLASGVAVTITWTNGSGVGGRFHSAYYVTGTTNTAVDTTGQATGTGQSISSGTGTATVADAIYCGVVHIENGTSTTSTPTNGVEVNDLYDSTDGQGFWAGYLVAASIASRAVTATSSNNSSTSNTGALAVFAGSGGGGSTVRHLAALGVG